MRQKTEITFEVEETILVKQSEGQQTEFCPNCHTITAMVPPARLAYLTGSSEREIFRLIETSAIHFAEIDRLIVCASCYRRSAIGSGTS